MPSERRRRKARPDATGNLLQVELLQEKAANLGRLARGLERALNALAEHDAAGAGGVSARLPHSEGGFNESEPAANPEDHDGDERRRRLLADAGEALFLYVVQREVLGLTGTAQALDVMGVPREVRLCMAPRSVLLAR